ncbi:aldehyde dehydrogenase family protein [Streptomyces albidoflavus]|uniref:aldehyde dehydrogenase family protein n=1 Tax=Streptomyces albidoflavus TaxID=1886 RepID=UPI000FF15B76|nr:aldehyde dehydrogenase family protein [Streptomyces albidoflavus]RWZ77816.1 aldehyde dehydrogenase family protein [Streptomyces albidoflavus]
MTLSLTIGGAAVPGAAELPVEDPATAEPFAQSPACSPEQLDAAVTAAAAAAADWARLPADDRRSALRACGEVLGAHLEEVAGLLSREQGKPLAAARAEVRLSADWFGHTAELKLDAEELRPADGARITLERVPHGVVAAIAPSNFPIILSVCKFAPALLAGNTVVVKPSPETPLSTLRMGELLRDCLPPGVLNVVSGDHSLGRALTEHPSVDMISFTGSVETGRAIARQAADRLLPVVLELGGNDAAIVLPGADISSLAPALFHAALANSGQFCAAVKRIYVPREQADELAGALAALAESAAVGPGSDPGSEFGPLVSRSQLERVGTLVEDAVARGARVLTGGVPLTGPGHFYAPTVLTGLPEGCELEVEEQFGPVIPVIAYDEPAEAVRRANATRYGLGASLWGPQEAADELAPLLDSGTVWINTHGDLRPDVPFGGVRSSGLGVEYGYWGLLEYTRIKVRNSARR